MVNQKIIVSGEIIDAKEVKNTDSGTFPPLMWESKPETCPPGTIRTITAATPNIELLNISESKIPISGSRISWIPKPKRRDIFSENKILICSRLLLNPRK